MKAERWQQVDQLFQAALEHAPEQRATFLHEACGGDDALRREVEALLAADHETKRLFEVPAYALAAPLLAGVELDESLVGQSIGHYQILALLGKGGMGEVYQARDTKLDRTVALKILPAEVATDAERMRRFVREAKAASALNHPHVATIYEIGEAESTHFIAMEYVAGQSLAAKINGAPLPLNEIIEIGSQIADALDEAHSKGITHRDIKPANVMLTPRGQVKVLDFGLAKITQPQPLDSHVSTLAQTQSGVVMGTVPYMSPEQALGREVDQRSDLFSLGVVLYEMATGRLPFAGANLVETLDRILHAQPEPIGRFNGEAPVELERIVRKCLAKEREARYQSAAELIAELKTLPTGNQAAKQTGSLAVSRRTEAIAVRFAARRWPVVAAIAVVLVVALVWFLVWRRTPVIQPAQIKSLAVLPLENLSGDAAQEYFADGMTEAIINNLSQVRALRVISRTSVMRFKDSRKPLAEIARELNVDAVIEGSVQRVGGRVKITARLIQAVNETPLRSFDYERELTDVLKLQSEVARAVANETRTQLTTEERDRLASARSVNPEAHEAYLLGRYHLRRQNEADLKLAIGHFERAIQLDTGYAAAWAGLSSAWQQRGLWGATPFREVEMPARRAAIKALELDAGSAEGYNSLAVLKNQFDWDWSGSEHDFRRAIELDPGNAEAHNNFAILLMALGRHAEAISEIQTAERLDPVSAVIQSDFGRVLYRARKYEEAEPHYKRALDLDPLNYAVYGRLSDLYAEMGRYTDALTNMDKAEALRGGSGRDRGYTARLARVYARRGRRNEALRLLKDLKRTTEPARFPKLFAAAAWAALGDKDEAFRLLFSAVEERGQALFTIKEDPPFDSLHSDPRWKELLRRMHFPEER